LFSDAFFLGKNSTYFLLVILVGVRGIELAIPESAVECITTEPNPLAFIAQSPYIAWCYET